MASETTISASGGAPKVTVSGGNLIRYHCQFFLEKPPGETWPGTDSALKKIHDVVFNKEHAATDTFVLGEDLETLSLNWVIDMLIPGGTGSLQYFAEVKVEQGGNEVMNWSDTGKLTAAKSIGDFSEFKVTP